MGIDNEENIGGSMVLADEPTNEDLPFEMGRSLFENALARGASELELRVSFPWWIPVYVTPETREPVVLKKQPLLKTEKGRVDLIKRAIVLSKQVLLEFIAGCEEFTIEGGAVYPIEALLQSGTKPEEIAKDQAVIETLAGFVRDSGKKFSYVPERMYKRVSKEKIVQDYADVFNKMDKTWKLTWERPGCPIDSRIDWHRRQNSPKKDLLKDGNK